MQALRLMLFLLLPVAAATVALVGMRKKVAPVGWKREAFSYGPVLGAGLSLVAFLVVIAASTAGGH